VSPKVRDALANAGGVAQGATLTRAAGGLGAFSTAGRSTNRHVVTVDDDRHKAVRQVAILVASPGRARVDTDSHEIVAQTFGFGASPVPVSPLHGDPEP
jgi:hypothetical protein